MLLLDRNKVLGRIKQGGGLDSARGPCVCHLSPREQREPEIYVSSLEDTRRAQQTRCLKHKPTLKARDAEAPPKGSVWAQDRVGQPALWPHTSSVGPTLPAPRTGSCVCGHPGTGLSSPC